jgi:hypothetical protein
MFHKLDNTFLSPLRGAGSSSGRLVVFPVCGLASLVDRGRDGELAQRASDRHPG